MSVDDQFGGGEKQPLGCKNIVGILLMIVGILVMLASGLCTVIFTVNMPAEILAFLIYGGIPFLLGFGLYTLGNGLRKSAQPPPERSDGNEPP